MDTTTTTTQMSEKNNEQWWESGESWVIDNWLEVIYIGGSGLVLVIVIITVFCCWRRKHREYHDKLQKLTVQPVKPNKLQNVNNNNNNNNNNTNNNNDNDNDNDNDNNDNNVNQNYTSNTLELVPNSSQQPQHQQQNSTSPLLTEHNKSKGDTDDIPQVMVFANTSPVEQISKLKENHEVTTTELKKGVQFHSSLEEKTKSNTDPNQPRDTLFSVTGNRRDTDFSAMYDSYNPNVDPNMDNYAADKAHRNVNRTETQDTDLSGIYADYSPMVQPIHEDGAKRSSNFILQKEEQMKMEARGRKVPRKETYTVTNNQDDQSRFSEMYEQYNEEKETDL